MMIKAGHLSLSAEVSSMCITITVDNPGHDAYAIVWRDGSSANVQHPKTGKVFTEPGSGVGDIPRLQEWAVNTIKALCVSRAPVWL